MDSEKDGDVVIDRLPSLNQLLKSLQQVPYLASKNMFRVASYFLSADDHKIEQFCRVLLEAKKNLFKCECCCVWQERGRECLFCADERRDQSLLCVVESWHDLLIIERAGGYRGVYHVLGGVICPLEGVGPENLMIDALIKRVESGVVSEIIFALNQTPEGEATAAYIAKKIRLHELKLSSLARGMPVGSSLEYMDRLTVHKALSERRPF